MAVSFDLFTNGRWSNPGKLVRLLGDSKCFGGCLISLHGPVAVAHEMFTGVTGSYEETVRSIRYATAAGIPVVLSTIITQKNYDLIDDMLTLGEEMEVSHLLVS